MQKNTTYDGSPDQSRILRVGSLIKKGYRVMIIMRGPPGVGKSFLARSLINKFVDLESNNYSVEDFVCSADDFFYNEKGEYNYNPALISDAHEFNTQRVQSKAQSGLSPIIVDNTNMKLWEMLPHVKIAVQNNYLIEILEPKTPWWNSPNDLAQKNKHGVTKHRIKMIIEKYESASVATLTKMLKNTKYSKTLPQMRSLPPLSTASGTPQKVSQTVNSPPKDILSEQRQSAVWNSVSSTVPKEQRIKFKSNISPPFEQNICNASSSRDVYSLLEEKTTNAWKPFESESANFWGTKPTNFGSQQISDSQKSSSTEKSLLDLLREDCRTTEKELQLLEQDNIDEKKSSFERHNINCPNENTAFVTLRQIYPNKRVSGLWDLFVKCNGDVDWAVDILLKEDELERLRDDGHVIYQSQDDELFKCLCTNENRETIPDNIDDKKMTEENIRALLNPMNDKRQRQRSRNNFRSCQLANPALLEVKENIENRFVLGDDLYSKHLLKIRNNRTGTKEAADCYNTARENYENAENEFLKNEEIVENGDDVDYVDEDNESDDCEEDMLEILLGEQLIQQLVETFKNESFLEEQVLPSQSGNLKVFMPKSLAKQLYMLWMESAYNHLEEKRQKLVREDEDFARLLKNPKYSEFKQSPSNLREILDMELAWRIYNVDKEEQQQRNIDMEELHRPNDLATHLSQMKLCETFPDIPRETLIDILAANDNDYKATIAVLESTMQTDNASTAQDHIVQCARREQILVNQDVQNLVDRRQERISNSWDDSEKKNSLPPDEVKRLALREFEESRNLAAHHCQLKAECYQKAKEAIQNGNGGAAIYYSQIANLHIKKIDMYNNRAANCIMDVHQNTQNNSDLLDLHYLYLIEALGCLDLFLDRHITGLRVASRNYKHVFIITGRGKHSAGGVSTIKNKVKARLKERCLRWSEVNPGLLKVKIFSGSRHSKNI